MTLQYRYDNLAFSTLLPNYINVGNPTGSIIISGSMPDGTSSNFATTITLPGGSTFYDVYAQNPTLFIPQNKVQLVSGASINTCYNFVSSESVGDLLEYSGNTLTVTITIDNFTGGAIVLVTQTINISVVAYQLPL